MKPTLRWALFGNLLTLGMVLLLWPQIGANERPLMASGHAAAVIGLFWAVASWVFRRIYHQSGRLRTDHPGVLVAQFLCLAGCVYSTLICVYFMVAQAGLVLMQTWTYTAVTPQRWIITDMLGTLDLLAVGAACLVFAQATSSAYFIVPMFWAMLLAMIRQCLLIPPVDPEVSVWPTVVAGAPSPWAPAMLLATAIMTVALVALQGYSWKTSRRRALQENTFYLLRPARSWPGLAPTVGALGFFILLLGCLLLVFPAPVGAFRSTAAALMCTLAAGMTAASVFVVLHRHWIGSLAEIAVGLVSLSICCASLALAPAGPSGLDERFPLLFTGIVCGCALGAWFWAWIAGVWEQQLDDQGTAWTTAGRLIPIAQRGSFMTGLFGVLFALQMSVWPVTAQAPSFDNSPGRLIVGLSSIALLACCLLWVFMRTGGRPFRLLTILAGLAFVFFGVVRFLPYTPMSYWIMRAVVQRVSSASVMVEGEVVGRIGGGLLVYLGVGRDDSPQTVPYMVNKIRHLRIFNDEAGKMNLDVAQAGGACLVVSAFSVQGDARQGHRPAYVGAAEPEVANRIYEQFCEALRASGTAVATGRFRAKMEVSSINDGPICILLDSAKTF